ncbi:TetR/AcrR family transcriptional regulator [Streptomyces sp. MS2.AVA.5]|uniref:TetR/AcrR family transcriptional regulator n=1 Tax=Streptomyces achmelvichensis TaxID=3134111 RepID=A0ACC6PPT2_9ACTN
MDLTEARTKLLDAAEELFYERGVQAVGMDEIRSASGVSLKRLYQVFPSKAELLRAYLDRRDIRWRTQVMEYADSRADGEERILAVYDWLRDWFAEPDFRGCAFINSYGELGAVDPAVAEAARRHKSAFGAYVASLVKDAGRPAELAGPLVLLAEGAMATAAITRSANAAGQARQGASMLLRATEPASTRASGM